MEDRLSNRHLREPILSRMAAHIARRLVILGAPGSGKGTIASRIVKTYGMAYVIVGDILRKHILERSGNVRRVG